MYHLELGSTRVVIIATVVAAAAGILVFAGGHGKSIPAASPKRHDHAPLPTRGVFVVDTVQRTVHTVALPAAGPGGVGGGFAWQASPRGVLQLNQRTGALITTLRLPVPTQDVLYAKGKLWATPHTERSPFIKTLLEIDPQTRRIRRIAVPGSFDTIFQGGGYIWVPGSHHIDRVNAATGRVNRALPFGLAQPDLLCAATFADGRLWLSMAGDPYTDQLVAIDPGSLRVLHHTTIPDPGDDEYCVTAGAGRIWAGSAQGYNIYAFDPSTDRRAGVSLQVGRMGWMAGTPGALWFSTVKDSTLLQAVNGDGAPLGHVRLPAGPLGFAGAGSLLYAGFTTS
jgi:outer membrane protein assembly factor BamB